MTVNIDEAIEALLAYRQADMEGVEVLTSRQAIHEIADELRRLRGVAKKPNNDGLPEMLEAARTELRKAVAKVASLEAEKSDLVDIIWRQMQQAEAHTFAPAQGWRTSDWDEAKKVGRILLVWKTAAGLSEHVELGKWSGSAWTNTYGKPFFGDPDGWAPLKPFAAQPPAAPVETDRQKLLEALPLQFQDGPDYCTVKDAKGKDFALTVQPDILKEMESALRVALVASSPVQRSSAETGGLKERVAIHLWHRFAPEGHMEWSEETHQAEYRDAAEGALILAGIWPKPAETKQVDTTQMDKCPTCLGDGYIGQHENLPDIKCPNCKGVGFLDAGPKLIFDTLKEAEDELLRQGFKLVPNSCDWIKRTEGKKIGAGCYYVDGEDAFNSKVRIEYESEPDGDEASAMQHDHYLRSGR